MDAGESLYRHVFCAIDLETTGINPLFHRIVEIGIVRFTLGGDRETWQSLVNPLFPIPAEALAVHGITDHDVSSAPVFSQVAHSVRDFCAGAIPVAHNPSFDMSFLFYGFSAAGIQWPAERAFDTVRMARAAFPGMRNHRLPTLCEQLEIAGTSHRALSDALACAEVFTRVIASMDPEGRWTLGDLMRFHGEMILPRVLRQRVNPSSMPGTLCPGVQARIRYMDSDGIVTERDIIPRAMVKMGRKSYLHAFCVLRGEDRYFLSRGILEIMPPSHRLSHN